MEPNRSTGKGLSSPFDAEETESPVDTVGGWVESPLRHLFGWGKWGLESRPAGHRTHMLNLDLIARK